MKKVIIVSKTHLDLGFTDYAENIKKKYIESFIPHAIDIAREVNTDGKKFVWTTGSWLLKEALLHGSEANKKTLVQALENGDIAPHGMPFTTHTELLDGDTLDYGLSIVEGLDSISKRKTVACKMTDVPGHTIGMVPLLEKHGMKLLHIGVNEASAMPDVPECFLWKQGGSEIIVIYSGNYGGEFKSEYIDDILYFDHTMDNHGATNAQAVLDNFNRIQAAYPGYEVTAGRLDDYAELIWQVKDKLPVIETEIGDSWIHGSAADPYKSGTLRTLIELKNRWLQDGTLARGSSEYITLADNLLCVSEHTCGMDMKLYLADYEHYLRKDFETAKEKDIVIKGSKKTGSYKAIEKSWAEQREYIENAVAGLSQEHQQAAREALEMLRPACFLPVGGEALDAGREYAFGGWTVTVNGFGGIAKLALNGENVIKENEKPALQYHSYGSGDYDFWLKHYTRNLKQTASWSLSDFARPGLERFDSQFKQGRFSYTLESGIVEQSENRLRIGVMLAIDESCHRELGAAKTAQIVYTLDPVALKIEVLWFGKTANRLTEATAFRMYPNCKKTSMVYTKLDTQVNPYAVVKNGNRNLSAVQNIRFKAGGKSWTLINRHSPLIGLGGGKILQFDNRFEDVEKDGITYILHNNVWGTNFPLWYEDNAYFAFELK